MSEFCFVCSRATDHFAEHDALVRAGLATYADNGDVLTTPAWDDELAAAISGASYAAYVLEIETGAAYDLDTIIASARAAIA